jgi:hypothetical protein
MRERYLDLARIDGEAVSASDRDGRHRVTPGPKPDGRPDRCCRSDGDTGRTWGDADHECWSIRPNDRTDRSGDTRSDRHPGTRVLSFSRYVRGRRR